MPPELQQNSTQRLEQAISTIFACRSVIKYNSVLNGEQKDELIADIDICLRSLRTGFTNDTTAQTILPHPQFQQVGKMTPISTTEKPDKDIHGALQELYRVYHAYIDTKQSNNIGTLVVRFDAAISALNDVQLLLERYYDVQIISSKDPLQCIHTFIADLYYMFMELVRTLSNVLEGNDIHIDTEKLSSMQERQLTSSELTYPRTDFAPLSEAFLEHQRLNEMKGALSRRISDSRAFLIFMRESFAGDFHKRNEILTHMNNVALLLEDLAYVLAGYEDAVGLLLESGRGDISPGP